MAEGATNEPDLAVARPVGGTGLGNGVAWMAEATVGRALRGNGRTMTGFATGGRRMTGATGPHPIAVVVVKTVHTAAFLVELTSILWLVLTGLVGRRDRSVALAAGAVVIEAAVFVSNNGVCPLTPLAERLGAGRGSVSDIFLPDAVARTIPIWSTALVALAALLHGRAVLCRDRG